MYRLWGKGNRNNIKNQKLNIKIEEAFRHLLRTDFSARLRLGRNDVSVLRMVFFKMCANVISRARSVSFGCAQDKLFRCVPWAQVPMAQVG
jgi:hypothetical protein